MEDGLIILSVFPGACFSNGPPIPLKKKGYCDLVNLTVGDSAF
jgi:hypothetical protein